MRGWISYRRRRSLTIYTDTTRTFLNGNSFFKLCFQCNQNIGFSEVSWSGRNHKEILYSHISSHRSRSDFCDKWSPPRKCSSVLCRWRHSSGAKKGRNVSSLLSTHCFSVFDRVDRGFLWTTIVSLGFNLPLVELLRFIGNHFFSLILVNGQLPFPMKRSVRQGDPLSMHLFPSTYTRS